MSNVVVAGNSTKLRKNLKNVVDNLKGPGPDGKRIGQPSIKDSLMLKLLQL
mgnify:CR=1 FL=1